VGVISLRRVVRDHPRPVRLKSRWLVIAGILGAVNVVFLVIGSTSFKESGYGGWNDFFVGLGALLFGLVLYLWRVLVQDRKPIPLRDTSPYVGDLAVPYEEVLS
jgi:hypothetical protein